MAAATASNSLPVEDVKGVFNDLSLNLLISVSGFLSKYFIISKFP